MSFKNITYDAASNSLKFASRRGDQTNITIPLFGMMPVGSIIAVLVNSPITGGAYSIPSPGTVDANGWMLCNGAAIPSNQSLTGSTPDLSDGRYLRGSTTSGTTGGANTQVSNVSVAAHTFTQPSAHVITQPAFNVPGHYHGKGNLGITDPGHVHNLYQVGGAGGGYGPNMGTPIVASGNSTVSATTSITLSGSYVGLNGGSNGDAAFAATLATSVALTNNHSGGGVDAHSVTNNAVNNEPQYLNVRYLIRVK